MGAKRDLMRERSFAIYFTASFVSNTGTFMQSLGVPFVLFRLTGSNTWVGAGVLANWAASLLVTPAAGLISDRLNRRVILMWSNAVQLVAAGGLVSYAAAYEDLYRRGAEYIDKILRGTKPADIPIEQPTKFDLVLNLTTAKVLGLTIREAFLLRADEVIE